MTYQEKWEFIVSEHQKLHNAKEEAIDKRWQIYCSELFGYNILNKEVLSQKIINVGVHDHAIPDILLSINEKSVFDIELKRYNMAFDIKFESQLISYFMLTHVNVGMIVCEQIVLYSYDYSNNSIKKVFIPFIEDNPNGTELMRLLEKNHFSVEAIHTFIDGELDRLERVGYIKELIRQNKMTDLENLELDEKYSADDIAQAVSMLQSEVAKKKPMIAKQHHIKTEKAVDSQIVKDKEFYILDVKDNVQFKAIYKAINAVVGKDYKGWQKACWPSYLGSDSTNFRIWFPKLTHSKSDPASFGCSNVLSDDWNELIYDDMKEEDSVEEREQYNGYSLVFAKDPYSGAPYLFRGVYLWDKSESSFYHHVYKRIGTKVEVIGTPAHTIKILDDNRENLNRQSL